MLLTPKNKYAGKKMLLNPKKKMINDTNKNGGSVFRNDKIHSDPAEIFAWDIRLNHDGNLYSDRRKDIFSSFLLITLQ